MTAVLASSSFPNGENRGAIAALLRHGQLHDISALDERMDRANKRPTRIRRRVLEAETGSGLDVRRLPGLAATDARPY